jgi:hypothetical protein
VDDGDISKELINDIDTDHSSTEGDEIDEKASKLKRIDSIKYTHFRCNYIKSLRIRSKLVTISHPCRFLWGPPIFGFKP